MAKADMKEIAKYRKPRKEKEHNPDNQLAEKIKIALIKRNMKYKDLADALEVTNGGINYRLNKNDFDETEMRKIAKAMGYDLEINFVDPVTKEKI